MYQQREGRMSHSTWLHVVLPHYTDRSNESICLRIVFNDKSTLSIYLFYFMKLKKYPELISNNYYFNIRIEDK